MLRNASIGESSISCCTRMKGASLVQALTIKQCGLIDRGAVKMGVARHDVRIQV